MKLRNLILTAAFVTVSAFGADIDGAWSGSLETPNGAFPIAYTFKAEGAKLTGSTMGPDGSELKIADGKVDGKNISFNQTIDFGGMAITISYKGVLDGTTLKLTGDFAGMPIEFSLKKA